MSSLRSLLHDARLRVVLLAETINAFGSGLSIFALAWFLGGRSPRFAGAVLTGQGIGPYLGTVVGRIIAPWATGVLLAANSSSATSAAVFGMLLVLTVLGFVAANSARDA
jgi:hypothetical protein